MGEVKHTPGPWQLVAADDYEIHSDAVPEAFPHHCKGDDLGRFVALIGNRADDFGRANARLIAAAPELLEALRELLDLHVAHHNSIEHAAARKAISKAEGRTP